MTLCSQGVCGPFSNHICSLYNNHMKYARGHNTVMYKVHGNIQEADFSHEGDLVALLKSLDYKGFKQVCVPRFSFVS